MHAHPAGQRPWKWTRAARRALAPLLVLLASGRAGAFTYVSGDVVAIFVDGNSELIVNLGPLSSLTPGTHFDFSTPPGFGVDGATGGKFLAYQTEPPFSGSIGRNLTFTTGSDILPPSYDTNITGYVSRIGIAQSALDDGAAADKYFEFLNNFPLPPTGGVITNNDDELALLTSNPGSYTATIGVGGTSDRIDNQLPFETDVPIGSSAVVALWHTEKVTNTTADTQLLGFIQVDGNVGSATTRITFLPEPDASSLMATGLLALGAIAARGRRRTA